MTKKPEKKLKNSGSLILDSLSLAVPVIKSNFLLEGNCAMVASWCVNGNFMMSYTGRLSTFV